MRISFDPAKREKNLIERSLDFKRVGEIFEGVTVTRSDIRQEYGEVREVTFGRLDDQIVVVVWTLRGGTRRIISMRKANEREIKKIGNALG
jgi:uncharacterized DUF497 family protein